MACRRRLAALLVALISLVAGCVDAGEEKPPIPEGLGRVRGSVTQDGAPGVDAQVLLWAGLAEAPGFPHPRPSAGVTTSDGEFFVDVEPGDYFLRVTQVGGTVCRATTVQVTEGAITTVDATCPA
jgi:hypothetical protein